MSVPLRALIPYSGTPPSWPNSSQRPYLLIPLRCSQDYNVRIVNKHIQSVAGSILHTETKSRAWIQVAYLGGDPKRPEWRGRQGVGVTEKAKKVYISEFPPVWLCQLLSDCLSAPKPPLHAIPELSDPCLCFASLLPVRPCQEHCQPRLLTWRRKAHAPCSLLLAGIWAASLSCRQPFNGQWSPSGSGSFW